MLSVDAPEVEVGDGRRARSVRGRTAVIDAVLELLHEGNLRLSVDDVARRAGVSPASVFRYFENLDELHRLAFEHQLEQVVPMLHIPGLTTLDPDRRVAAFAAGRLRVYEVIAGPARMCRVRAAEYPVVADSLTRARRLWLRQVRDVFARELAPLGRAERRDVAAMVDTVASFEAWDLLRTSHDIPTRSIQARWSSTILQLVGAGPTSQPPELPDAEDSVV